MDLYLVSLATGAVGLGIMALGGLSRGSHSGAAHSHAGHTHAGHHSAPGGHVHAPAGSRWTSLLSPRVLFSLFVGFGAAGIAAAPLGEPFQMIIGAGGALAFEGFVVGPLWRFLFRFESRPAATLESAVEDEAHAVTGFDVDGNGLVSVNVDGQLIQLLATLSADERSRGTRVRRGDTLRIANVDAGRGRCTVTLPIP